MMNSDLRYRIFQLHVLKIVLSNLSLTVVETCSVISSKSSLNQYIRMKKFQKVGQMHLMGFSSFRELGLLWNGESDWAAVSDLLSC